MNDVKLLGRTTKKPELSPKGEWCHFTLAVDRHAKDKNGNDIVDFVPCVVWGSDAKNFCSYVQKGHQVIVSGNITTRSEEYLSPSTGKKVLIPVSTVSAKYIEYLGPPNGKSSGSGAGDSNSVEGASDYVENVEF